jgi:hypothetical protein
MLLFVLLFLVFLSLIGKAYLNWEKSNDTWKVKTVNYGFAVVVNQHNQDLLVRNPVPNLKVGDDVVVKGFKFSLDSNLQYVDSKIK